MKKHLALVIGLLVVVAALSGCGKSTKPTSSLGTVTGGGNATDVAQITDAVTANPQYVNEDVYTTATPTIFTASPGGAYLVARPLRWWRQIDSTFSTRSTSFSDVDSLGHPHTALVTITRDLFGTFHVLPADSLPRDSARVPVIKPLHDSWVRKLLLTRKHWAAGADSLDPRAHDDWRIVGTSAVLATSENATTHIQSVRVQVGSVDTTLTDPLQLYHLTRAMFLPPMTPVHLTVTTSAMDNKVFLYRTEERRAFSSNGDGTYSLQFTNMDWDGLRHFGVDAFTSTTFTDPTAAYDSQAWILPFGVRGPSCDIRDRH